MKRRVLPAVVAAVLLGGIFCNAASAIELARVLVGERHAGAPAALASPEGYSAGIPAPHRYPEYNQCSPWYGYGLGVPTYSWGWFGAKYRPASLSHSGYYGDFSQWGYRRGY